MDNIALKITLSLLILSLALLVFGCQTTEIPPEEQPAADVPAAAEVPAEVVVQQESAPAPEKRRNRRIR